jgi:predicted ArsR family transcriptional regulator
VAGRRPQSALGSSDDLGYQEARALADPTRRQVLRAIIDAGRPVHVAELTDLFDLHHTAIRQHLTQLGDAGLVSSRSTPPHGRGRPRLAYQATDRASSALQPAGRYRELAAMLVEAVRGGEGTRQAGRRIGQRIGRRHRGADPVAVIVDEAAQLGFDPATRTRSRRRVDVVLRHCPFQDVAAQDPATICQLHLGLAEGIATSVGGLAVTGMTIRDPHRAGCRMALQRQDPAEPVRSPPRSDARGVVTTKE